MTPTRHSQSRQPMLKSFLDRELPLWRQLAVRLHLARCASCREDLRAMRQIGDELRGQAIDPLDPKLKTRILASVQEITPVPTPPMHIRRPVLIWVGGAAALLLLASVTASRMRFAPMSLSGSSRAADSPAAMSNSVSEPTPASRSFTGSAASEPQNRSQAALIAPRDAVVGRSEAKQKVALRRAGFDIDGYRFVTLSGQRIDIPFKANLNSLRFARAEDGRMTLTQAFPSPILSLGPADALQNDAVPGSRWQPLPASFSSLRPLYVRPVADWTQFTALRWYPNMTLVGGFASPESNDASFVWLSGSYVRIGQTLYPDFAAYRAYADVHPDAVYLRPIYQLSAAPILDAAKRSGSAHGASHR
jgi:anti-sigma factor RsiW